MASGVLQDRHEGACADCLVYLLSDNHHSRMVYIRLSNLHGWFIFDVVLREEIL